MAAFQSFVVCLIVAFAVVVSPTCADLCPDFYTKVCPDALSAIRSVVQNAINHEARNGASLLRL
jgi:peroxidase